MGSNFTPSLRLWWQVIKSYYSLFVLFQLPDRQPSLDEPEVSIIPVSCPPTEDCSSLALLLLRVCERNDTNRITGHRPGLGNNSNTASALFSFILSYIQWRHGTPPTDGHPSILAIKWLPSIHVPYGTEYALRKCLTGSCSLALDNQEDSDHGSDCATGVILLYGNYLNELGRKLNKKSHIVCITDIRQIERYDSPISSLSAGFCCQLNKRSAFCGSLMSHE